ncbi:MAG: hypothetical protein HETSPECPRED_000586 [Heterodermia speciosa]|uniref:Rhamnogalacturonase A/B/Epimerase-like pectate lyase domain-containing protein n=1 Tax=Heterodermia speciosa TaxID=116794 RepID=A0A8H3G863_9LECA|nr:MAG: hypothetical protein HETSPECPRED_000586 [Heterodermia speciosa]
MLAGSTSLTGAVPATAPSNLTRPSTAATSSSYWLANIKRQGTVAFGDSAFKIYRNVQDYGAKGDGISDDTAAINAAITDGGRCGQGCDSSTVTPALVYFPPGTYLVSAPIVQLYYTQFVGDAISVPTLKAASNFAGIAVIDSDPYAAGGVNWYTNQNNFFRQVRNFVIDLTGLPVTTGTGIHWQVAQATSLQNIRFEMIQGGDSNKQQGIFMDNGSGGWMSDLVFNGGHYGAFLGNQQFTTRNLKFNNVQTAIFMNWNWVWTFKSITISNCGIGVDMSNNPASQTVGSVIIQDSSFSGTPKGVVTAYSKTANVPATGGTLILDNVDFTGSANAVVDQNGGTILAGGSKIASWAQGHTYTSGADASAGDLTCASSNAPAVSSANVQGALQAASKPASLLDGSGAFFQRSKPQYENIPASSFLSVKSAGAKGDGITDDTAAIQAIFNKATAGQIVYFDHGAYLITQTVKVPNNIKITGEIWPLIMASGSAFSSQTNPAPVFQIGQPGSTGAVEMSDLMFETKGAAPGAIVIQWNLGTTSQGSSGMWDVHVRIGGTAGTGLQSDTCSKNPSVTSTDYPKCDGAFLMLHVTATGSVYLENTWFWVADHDLDRADHAQINIYNGRGVLIESNPGPVWLYGTSSEHSQLYNYQISNARNVYMGLIQTETPYMQANPIATAAFAPSAAFHDPTFTSCTTNSCRKAWGLRVLASTDVYMYGGGLYSFFDNYDQGCLSTESCQVNMVAVDCSKAVWLWGLSTKASTNMVTVDGKGVVAQADNRDNFCSTIALFHEN